MAKRLIFIIIVLVIIFGGTFGFDIVRRYFMRQYFSHFQPPPVTVSITRASAETWHPTLNSVGTLQAVNGVDINSRVSGQVVAIYFQSGQTVKKNQQLIQLDDAIDQQTLKNDMATLQLAKLTYQRRLQVFEKTRGAAKSDVDEAKAKLLQAEASVATAQLNIYYKNIKAPFAGKIGIRKVNIGQYVTAGQSLVTLQSLNPLYVDFSLPEQDLDRVYTDQPIQITVDTYPNEVFKGKVTAINSKVDIETRSILIRATIPNKDQKLYPGVYANVTVILPEKKNVITVPQTAVTYSLYGDSVYVVSKKGKDKKGKPILIAQQRFITVGPRKGTVVSVLKGIQPGENIVTSGQIKLRSGSRVTINNTLNVNQ